MKLASSALLAVAGVLAVSGFAIGAETFVACPVQQVEASVTTSLPGGWWATPQQGELKYTEVTAVAGKKRLVCNYRVFGTHVPVMGEMPKGYSVCKPAPGGFRCGTQGVAKGDGSVRTSGQNGSVATQASAAVPVVNSDSGSVSADAQFGAEAPVAETDAEYDVDAQASVPAPVATGAAASGLIDEEAARQQVEKFIKKQVSGDKKRVARVCGDPAAVYLGVKAGSISATPTKDPNVTIYAFRLEGEVKNVADTAFTSSGGLQSVELYEMRGGSNKPRLVTTLPFESLAAGESLMIGTDLYKWGTYEKRPDYQLRVTFAPEIYQDGDPANDECDGKNNIVTLRSTDINDVLLSGT